MANPKSLEARQAYIDHQPFTGLKISDHSLLNDLEGRSPCPQCGKSRKFFCYTCYVPISELEGKIPKIELPIKIDIIKHRHEIDGKSTAGHAAIIAPNHVRIYTYPNIPDYSSENAVLIFPSFHAVSIDKLFEEDYMELCSLIENSSNDVFPKGFHHSTLMKNLVRDIKENNTQVKNLKKLPISKAVFIDSTWNQSKGIYKDENIRKLPCVVLQNRVSQFWRHQKGSPRWYLATIEAIHQFLVEIHLNAWGLNPSYKGIEKCFSENTFEKFYSENSDNAYNGQYDDLLYFFRHLYDVIHEYYQHENLYAYKRRLV